ncbi:MAG: NUDIX domain-containing protein [Candidatus Moraniibacteriota bacterium]
MSNLREKNNGNSKDLVFNYYLSRIKKRDVHFLFIIHLTRTIEVFIESWLKNFPNVGVISINYSEIPEVKENISKYAQVYSPSDVSEIPELITKICNQNLSKKICTIEIGGYSSLIKRIPDNIIGAVEDTNQGHWSFKQNESRLTYPVISIAQTNLKKIENKFVGSSISYSLEKFLRDHFQRDLITIKNILVIGYGEVGRGTARKLKSTLANVFVYDSDPVNTMLARLDGFNITDRISAISQADIIIGASGQQSLQMSDFVYLKNNCLLISASSRQVEFPIDEIEKNVIKKSSYINSYRSENGLFYVAYNGFPINFIDDSAFGEIFDIIMSSLLVASDYILDSNLLPKVYDLDLRLQQDIVRKYFELYEMDNHEVIFQTELIKNKRHDAASALIVSKNAFGKLSVLLLNHPRIGKWIPIGGHVERFESPESAVLRELEDEIGISPIYWFDKKLNQLVTVPVLFCEMLEKIDAHKDSPVHYHRDYIYVAMIDYQMEDKFTGTIPTGSLKWLEIDDILKLDIEKTTPETLQMIKDLKVHEKELLG